MLLNSASRALTARPIAAILTLEGPHAMIFKYGRL
jgi:hypothetical protein